MNLTISDEKKRRYLDLIRSINSSNLYELNSGGGVQFECFDKCVEVNLWSYWEGGIDHLNADILLVGQDWGTLDYQGETIVKSLEKDTFDRSKFCYMQGNSNPTNLSLCELFKEINRDYDLQTDHNTYTDLFFTNFIPWYRKAGKISGGFKASWVRHSACFFAELIDIIQPKVILCLGRSVFEGVLGIGNAKVYPSGKTFNDIITEGPIEVRLGSSDAFVFPLAHCGSYGTLNRNNREKLSKEHVLDLQKQDWQKIKIVLL